MGSLLSGGGVSSLDLPWTQLLRATPRTALDDTGTWAPLALTGGNQALGRGGSGERHLWGGLARKPGLQGADWTGPCLPPPGLPVHPQGHNPAALQPPAPDPTCEFDQEDPVPSGIAGPLLEAL